MTRTRIAIWTLTAALAATSLVVGRAVEPESKSRSAISTAAQVAGDKVRDKRMPEPPRWIGSMSCSAANCHGGLTPDQGIGGEHSLWQQHDPHAKAYAVLFNDLSQHMIEQLQSPIPAHEHSGCLICHAPAANWTRDPVIVEGVGCEQCHGPAERWLEPHVHPRWKSRPLAEKTLLGFRNLHDVSERARICVECHVGVNHDLIAAGHPRLFFEMSAFHANLPAHWRRENDWSRHAPRPSDKSRQPAPTPPAELRQGRSHFEAQLWVTGQWELLRYTAMLIKTHAGHGLDNNPRVPWPELSHWNCFACHHDLQGPSWRQSRSSSSLAISKPGLNSWPLALLDFLPAAGDERRTQAARDSFAKLQNLMSRPYPPPQEIYDAASRTQDDMTSWITAWQKQTASGVAITRPTIDDWLRRLCGAEGERRLAENWDSATQMLLGVSALTHAAHAADDPASAVAESQRQARLAVLDSMREALNFPDEFQSPRKFTDDSIQRLQFDLRRLRMLIDSPEPRKTP